MGGGDKGSLPLSGSGRRFVTGQQKMDPSLSFNSTGTNLSLSLRWAGVRPRIFGFAADAGPVWLCALR